MSATPAFDFIPEPLARYRFHPGTMMKDDLRARKHANLGYLHLRLDEPLLARQAFRRAIIVAPGFLPRLSPSRPVFWRVAVVVADERSPKDAIGPGGLVTLWHPCSAVGKAGDLTVRTRAFSASGCG